MTQYGFLALALKTVLTCQFNIGLKMFFCSLDSDIVNYLGCTLNKMASRGGKIDEIRHIFNFHNTN